MPLERPFVYVFKFPFHTNVCMLKLSSDIIHVTCKTCTNLKSHHKLRATQLLVTPTLVLHRKGSKGPRKPIRGPYTDYLAVSQEQSTTSSRHSRRQTIPPKGGPETTGVIDNVSKTKHAPPPCFFLSYSGAASNRLKLSK
jgi:hypothetical protein